MNDVKWIKLYVSLLDDDKMIALETLPEGTMLELIWFKLLCLAGSCNRGGCLSFSADVPYTEQMMARRFRVSEDAVRRALDTFQQLHMIEIVDNICCVSNWTRYQSEDRLTKIRAYDAERKRLARAKSSKPSIGTSSGQSVEVPPPPAAYSFNTNNNVKNLEHVLESHKEEYAGLMSNNRLMTVLKNWMEYKDERKPKTTNHYGSEKGIKTLITRFLKCEKDYGMDVVEELVNNSIANNWQGIMWDNAERTKKTQLVQKPKKQLYIPPKLT